MADVRTCEVDAKVEPVNDEYEILYADRSLLLQLMLYKVRRNKIS
jgi:hypothetical protein